MTVEATIASVPRIQAVSVPIFSKIYKSLIYLGNFQTGGGVNFLTKVKCKKNRHFCGPMPASKTAPRQPDPTQRRSDWHLIFFAHQHKVINIHAHQFSCRDQGDPATLEEPQCIRKTNFPAHCWFTLERHKVIGPFDGNLHVWMSGCE